MTMTTPRTIGAIARREMGQIASDRWTLIAITVMPLVMGTLLTLIYASGVVRDLPTLVIDHDRSAASREFTRVLDAHESVRVIRTAESDAEGEGVLRSGEASVVVVIPAEFESMLKRGNRVALTCLLNGSNMVTSNYGLKAVTAAVTTASAGVAIDRLERKGTSAAHAAESYGPIAVSPRYVFNPGQNYANFFVPGILAALLQQVIVIGAALTWVREFRSGDINDLLRISRSVVALAAGKLLVYLLIGAAWAAIFFMGLFSLARIPNTGSVLAGTALTLLMITGMALLAMLISAFCSHRETAIQITFIVSSPAFLLSGYTFPQMAMSAVARYVGCLVPLTPFLTGWRRVVLYGGGWADVSGQLLSLAYAIVVYGILMACVIRRRIRAIPPSQPLPLLSGEA